MNLVINGLSYHVVDKGEGFPLVLLHGFTGDASSWAPFFPLWKKQAAVYAVDIIGHGKTVSPESVEHYNILSVAKDLADLLEEIGIEKTDLLGYSMGGRLALTFSSLYPERVRKLILESSTPGLKTEEERATRRRRDNELAMLIEMKGIRHFVDYWESVPLFETQKKLPETIRRKIRKQRLQNSTIGLANSLRGMGTGAQPSWWNRLAHLNIPVLLITGTLDHKFQEIASEMAVHLPQCEWVQVKNCGHAIHVEESEKFGTIVSEFLSNT